MAKIGYINKTPYTESLDKQRESLRKYGVSVFHTDLDIALENIRNGDIFVVHQIECMDMSMSKFDKLLWERLYKKDAHLALLQEDIDTSKSVMNLCKTLGCFSDALLHLDDAYKKHLNLNSRKPSSKPGRKLIVTPKIGKQILRLLAAGKTIQEACKEVGINRRTYYRWKDSQDKIT